MKSNLLSHLKRNKKLLMILLAVGVSSSCAHQAPAPPIVAFYIHDQPAGLARGSTSDGKPCEPVAMSRTANWIMFPPSEWLKVQGYTDLLVCKISGGCPGILREGVEHPKPNKQPITITSQDLEQLSKYMHSLSDKYNFEQQATIQDCAPAQ